LAAAREIASRLPADESFDAAIVEAHHRKKLDAPSGTALLLQQELKAANPSRAFPITSVRIGAIPGTHSVLLDASHESLELTHTVRDRRVFAAGAVTAAEWLPGRRGVFTFDDLFNEVGASR
jgi:4-hydroxy-tetrahydrodipicolinate reductase